MNGYKKGRNSVYQHENKSKLREILKNCFRQAVSEQLPTFERKDSTFYPFASVVNCDFRNPVEVFVFVANSRKNLGKLIVGVQQPFEILWAPLRELIL